MCIDLILPSIGEILILLDILGPDALRNPDHPQELVDVVTALSPGSISVLFGQLDTSNLPRIPNQATEDDQQVIDIVLAQDRVGMFFVGSHDLSDGGDMS